MGMCGIVSFGVCIHPNSDFAGMVYIIVEVEPYIGPHLSVGKDRITLKVTNQGIVSVEKFMHIESYELPANHQDIIIKPF